MAFSLARLFVEIGARTQPFERALDGVKAQLGGVAGGLGSLASAAGVALGGAALAGAGALAVGLYKGVRGASDLAETMSKVGVVFGDSAGQVTEQADEMARAFGLPKQEVLDAAAGIGLIGKAAGQSQGDAATMANQMAKLAADASSFYNVPLEESLQKIKSALVGESEPIRSFGVLLSEAAVSNEAMALGLSKTGKDLTEQQKVMARSSLIVKGLADAQGDLERTQDSTSNQFRKLSGTIGNLATEIGQALLPAVDVGINLLNDLVGSLVAGFEASKETITGFASGVGEAFQVVGVTFRNLPLLWELTRIRIAEGVTNIIEWFGVIPANLAQIGGYVAGNWQELILDGVNAVAAGFQNLITNISNLGSAIGKWLADPTAGFEFQWTPLLKGFEATAEQLPELIRPHLTSMQGEVDRVARQIADNEAARATKQAAGVKAAEAKKAVDSAVAGGAAKEFKPESFALGEAARKLRAGAATKDDTPKQSLATLKQIARTSAESLKLAQRGGVARLA